MSDTNIIGGEFEISNDLLHRVSSLNAEQRFYTYSSGRSALFNILESISTVRNANRILIPDYICDSVLITAEKAGCQLLIYDLDESLKPNIRTIRKMYTGTEVVLVVDYFGCIDCRPIIEELRKIDEQMIIVQDNVQAPFSMLGEQLADYSFSSFRKSFPVPDGSWAFTKDLSDLPYYKDKAQFSSYKIAGSILKGIGIHNDEFDNVYLSLFAKGESLIDENYHTDMSILSKQIINFLDWNRIKAIRLRNAKTLIKGLAKLGIKPLVEVTDDHMPLFVPITLPNRDEVRKKMFSQNIFCPIHWSINENLKYGLKKGEELQYTELSLIVDQRYTNDDMRRMLRVLEDNI